MTKISKELLSMLGEADIEAMLQRFVDVNNEILATFAALPEDEQEVMREMVDNHIAKTKAGVELLIAKIEGKKVN